MNGIFVGELAREVGVKITTIRFYERRGLIPKPPRSESGYRVYPYEIVERVRFIKRAQELGFSLEEISGLLDLRVSADVDCSDVHAFATVKLALIAQKINDLQKMQRSLAKLMAACHEGAPTSECPILEALSEQRKR